MSLEALRRMDLSAGQQPDHETDERSYLEAWYRYQRHEFLRKLRDLSPDQLVAHAVPPVELSVMGLVRHMTQMEHVYVVWGLGGGERVMVYHEDDYHGATVEGVDADLSRYLAEVERAEAAIAAMVDLDTPGDGHGRPLRAVLVKMLDEYALHAGQAHMIRFAALGELKR
ncbi:MAG: DUF664 domain-containing protein [Actinomycetota bacterium]